MPVLGLKHVLAAGRARGYDGEPVVLGACKWMDRDVRQRAHDSGDGVAVADDENGAAGVLGENATRELTRILPDMREIDRNLGYRNVEQRCGTRRGLLRPLELCDVDGLHA